MLIISLLSVSLTASLFIWESDYFFYLPLCGAVFGCILGAVIGRKAEGRNKLAIVMLIGAFLGFLLAMIPMWGWINFV